MNDHDKDDDVSMKVIKVDMEGDEDAKVNSVVNALHTMIEDLIKSTGLNPCGVRGVLAMELIENMARDGHVACAMGVTMKIIEGIADAKPGRDPSHKH